MSRHFTDTTLLIASHNNGKVKELAEMFSSYSIKLISAAELNIPEPEETGATFIENAILKAKYYSEASGLPALADDSGLAVDALNGQPGIHSARWGGEQKDFMLAMKKVEQLVGDNPNRNAAFICALSLWWPDAYHVDVEGKMEGSISFPPRGEKGFGYDPIFVAKGYDITCSEMNPDAKNAISHRAKAFSQLISLCFK